MNAQHQAQPNVPAVVVACPEYRAVANYFGESFALRVNAMDYAARNTAIIDKINEIQARRLGIVAVADPRTGVVDILKKPYH